MVRMNRNHTIQLSGAEQVCVMLKSWSGSWKKLIATTKHQEDKVRAKRLEAFEQRHNVKIKYSSTRNEVYFICTKRNTKEANSQ